MEEFIDIVGEERRVSTVDAVVIVSMQIYIFMVITLQNTIDSTQQSGYNIIMGGIYMINRPLYMDKIMDKLEK